jgi:hypothetical protein
VEDKAFRFGLRASAGPYPGLPPSQDRFLDRPGLCEARWTPRFGLLRHPPLHGALRHPQHGGGPPGGSLVRYEQKPQAGLGA